jgi:hypothetical protein
MSLLFGSGKRTKPQYSSLQVQTSSSNMPVTLAWGLCRLSPNIIWYGDFKSHKAKAQGGKGGGGKGGAQYTYTTALQMALCQGVSAGIQRIFVDNDKTSTLSKLNLVFFSGTDTQAPWSYLATNHPSEALNYPGLVHVDSPKYDLGSSASLPQHSFETECRLYNSAPGAVGDADVALVIQDYLTAPVWGCGFPSAELDTVSLLSGPDAGTIGDAASQTYCTAMGFGMSPMLSSQENGLTILDRWCKLFNLAPVWNGASLKFVPYALEGVTGNGVIFVPNTTSAYTLADADYIGSSSSPEDPVKVRRADFSKVKNRLQLEILSRDKEYNAVPIEYVEQGLVDQHGDMPDSVFQGHEITVPDIATKVVTIMVLRNAFRGANSYTILLGPEFCLLEPMDLLTVSDPQFGTVQIQIDVIDEDEDHNLTLTCSQVSGAASNAAGFTAPDQTPGGNDTGIDPGSVNTPILLEPASTLTSGVPQVWAAVSGASPNWGGCFVWVSSDNTTYTEIGEITSPARMGVTTGGLPAYASANPDTTDSVGVDLTQSLGILIGVTATDAANGVTLCYLGGELLTYRDALLTTTSHYTLGGQLYRGLYGTTASLHALGVPFARLDDAIFKFTLPVQYIGQTLYFKFQSYNIFGGGVQDLSTCTAYTLAPAGTGYGSGVGGAPVAATGIVVSSGAGFNKVTWTTNVANDNIVRYDVYRANGSGASFGSASLIGSSSGNTYTDNTAAPGQAYTYFVVAVNEVGAAPASAGSNGTSTSLVLGAQPYGFAFQWPNPTASKPIGFFDTPIAWTIPAGLTNCQGSIGDSDTATAAAPSAQTDFDIQSPPGTSIGTMRFASGALTATFIKASSSSIPLGQAVAIIAPSALNGIAGTVYGSIIGTG